MEYYQKLSTYFAAQGYAPQQVSYLSMAAYVQAQQQVMQATMSPQQALIQQFMSLNDGQKMQFVQKWLLQNPSLFKKDSATA
jgi:hypothetical protein